ncbi:MAG: hypothetical protein QNK04_33950, partial [Myxococcota bacterium]|nr:hypothetical protein [Myxococcota bacterium]
MSVKRTLFCLAMAMLLVGACGDLEEEGGEKPKNEGANVESVDGQAAADAGPPTVISEDANTCGHGCNTVVDGAAGARVEVAADVPTDTSVGVSIATESGSPPQPRTAEASITLRYAYELFSDETANLVFRNAFNQVRGGVEGGSVDATYRSENDTNFFEGPVAVNGETVVPVFPGGRIFFFVDLFESRVGPGASLLNWQLQLACADADRDGSLDESCNVPETDDPDDRDP